MSASEWSNSTPWLDCRKRRGGVLGIGAGLEGNGEGKTHYRRGEKEDDELGAGCACWECWPEQVWTDTHVSYCP